jgi:hypothetical protein
VLLLFYHSVDESTNNPLRDECMDTGSEIATETETETCITLNSDEGVSNDQPKTLDDLRQAYLLSFEYEFMVGRLK